MVGMREVSLSQNPDMWVVGLVKVGFSLDLLESGGVLKVVEAKRDCNRVRDLSNNKH